MCMGADIFYIFYIFYILSVWRVCFLFFFLHFTTFCPSFCGPFVWRGSRIRRQVWLRWLLCIILQTREDTH